MAVGQATKRPDADRISAPPRGVAYLLGQATTGYPENALVGLTSLKKLWHGERALIRTTIWVWLNLVERLLWEQAVGGSNPSTQTGLNASSAGELLRHPDVGLDHRVTDRTAAHELVPAP